MSAKPLPVDTGPPPGGTQHGPAAGSIAGAGEAQQEADLSSRQNEDSQTQSPSTAPEGTSKTSTAAEDQSMSTTAPDAATPNDSVRDAGINATDSQESTTNSPSASPSDANSNDASPPSPDLQLGQQTPASAPSEATIHGFHVGVAPSGPKKASQRARGGKASQSKPTARTTTAATSATSQPIRATMMTGGPSKPQSEPVAWTTAGTAKLRESLSEKADPAKPAGAHMYQVGWRGDPALLEHFKCAIAPANKRRDGEQRLMTKFEEDVLFKWQAHKLHLAQPPRFIQETHTSAEQDVFNDFHLEHGGFRLHGLIPIGVKISVKNAKYDFCHAVLHACGKNQLLREQVKLILAAADTIHCIPRSSFLTIRFVYPQDRDRWNGFTLPIGNASIILTATDSLTTDIPSVGLDPPACRLLYSVYLHALREEDTRRLRHQQVRAFGTKASGVSVFSVELVESRGVTDFAGPRWKLVWDQVFCPAAFEHVRRIEAAFDDHNYTFVVQHPRVSHRLPCSKCLSIRHATKDCKNVHAASSLEKHTCRFTLDDLDQAPKLTAALAPAKAKRQWQALRQKVAPALAVRLKADEALRLKLVEQKAQEAAKKLAKEAADEARVQTAAKEQVAADQRRKAKAQERESRRDVTSQLKQLTEYQQAQQRLQDGFSLNAGQNIPGAEQPPKTSGVSSVSEPTVGEGLSKPKKKKKTPTPQNPAQQRPQKESSPHATVVPQSTALTIYIPPTNGIGKRTAPPSPSGPCHSPESAHVRKWHKDDYHHAQHNELSAPEPANNSALAARAPTGSKRPDGDKKPVRQMPLSAFFAPQSFVEAQAQLDQEVTLRKLKPVDHWLEKFPSPELDRILEALHAPSTLDAWAKALAARIVNTPANGGCLHFALHGCRCRRLGGNNMTLCTTHIREANHYKYDICDRFLEYLEPMLDAGTITLGGLMKRFFNLDPPTDKDAAIRAVRQFILGVRDADLARGLTRTQWGADEDLCAAVWYIREPLFVITEHKDKATSVRVIRIDRTEANGPERIVEYPLAADEAFEMLRTFLRHRTIPTVIVHKLLGDDGHWVSFRFDDRLFTAWTKDDHEGLAMRARVDQVLAALGWYIPPRRNDGIPKYALTKNDTAAPAQLASGSVYEPSSSSSLDSSLTDDELAPMTPDATYALLSALNPRRRRRGAQAALWEQAERANFAAYRLWDEQQVRTTPREDADTITAGCRFWSKTSQLVSLLRSLPYPEVAMALLPDDILQRLGNELNDLTEDGSVPTCITSDDSNAARREWNRLVAAVVVSGDDELIALRSVNWLRENPQDTVAALHALRLHDWTVIGGLTHACSIAQPTRQTGSGQPGGDRL